MKKRHTFYIIQEIYLLFTSQKHHTHIHLVEIIILVVIVYIIFYELLYFIVKFLLRYKNP